ncbi:hypothetical protein L6Q21_03110 [Sandaracinobacter sp. RS1-74]|uniref:hypothetical protein n=1 Tax=Sandaracinobacteroides sayramensis TaxID=2913411 RepID=UPI001EDB222E|nr:hypothetical protein [Sandaracinobacteroides sayramensis]MCG2839971.1 hypothetical protein [Sandaracinobacteroides sayramensis]
MILGAGLRPLLEDLLDRLSRRLRIEVRDDRKLVLYIPDGIDLLWRGAHLQRVVQQEVILENNTQVVFDNVRLRLRFKPYNAAALGEKLLLGAVILPSPEAEAVLLPDTAEGERIMQFKYISPQSRAEMRVFTNVDGEIEFDTLCDKEVVVRHTGVMFSETARNVMPTWMAVLKPVVLPFTIVAVLRQRLRRSRQK